MAARKKARQHGGERAGAGRPAKHDEGPMVACALKVRPSLLERLRAVAWELEITQAEVLEMGVAAAEKAARRKHATKTSQGEER